MNSITCKFGGTSLADAEGFRQAISIIWADARRRFIVPSAPGKRHPEDRKVTDILFAWHEDLESEPEHDLSISAPAALVTRFKELSDALGVDLDVERHLNEIAEEVGEEGNLDYTVSRGEYLNGLMLAQLLDAQFVSPCDHIVMREDGSVDPETYTRLRRALAGDGRFVIPGYYGALPDGTVKTFSRGGSDITGAIVARATESSVYENWTDISGFRVADPRIVPEAGRMEEVTYRELRELAYMGANVFHEEAVFPVQEAGIPIEIRNTKRPDEPGTTIRPSRNAEELVCGIAGIRGFSTINVNKTLMNKRRRYLHTILGILDDHDILVEHVATGIDAISLAVRTEQLDPKRRALQEAIIETCQPTSLAIEDGYSIVATVGQGMEGRIGMAARLCQALADRGISIHLIDQGSPENNIIVGVKEMDHDGTIRAIYDEFIGARADQLESALEALCEISA